MVLNEYGEIVHRCWMEIPQHFPHVELDAFVIMPNHVHGIIVIIEKNVGANNHSPRNIANIHSVDNIRAKNFSPLHEKHFHSPSRTIGSVVRGFKIGVTKWFRQHTNIYTVWQRNYYEHIVRDEMELNRIREYIYENPMKWENDENYRK